MTLSEIKTATVKVPEIRGKNLGFRSKIKLLQYNNKRTNANDNHYHA